MKDMSLGKLKKVELRNIWEFEDRDFTPWLALEENLQLLGETIGIDLELEAKEEPVGPFRADILCKDTTSDQWVLIENQLARTDHTHLGQLITYAAGLKAATIVWIANPFTEEHRAALDWLNEISEDRFNFLGLEVELWSIGDSEPAPKFNIVSKPNDWSRDVAAGASRVSGELTDVKRLRLSFWTIFREFLLAADPSFQISKASGANYMDVSIGRAGFKMSPVASMKNTEEKTYETNELRVDFVILTENSKDYFEQFSKEREAIEEELGYPLTWYSLENVQMCRMYVRRVIKLEDETQWPDYHNWLFQRLTEFRNVFGARVKEISP